MTQYLYLVQMIVTDRAAGAAAMVDIFGAGNETAFDDALPLQKDGTHAWGTECVALESEYLRACELRDAGGLIRCTDRGMQYTLRQWAAELGYSVGEVGP